MRFFVISLLLQFCSGIKLADKTQSEKSLLNLGVMLASYIDCPLPYFPIPYGCWCGITIPFPAENDPIDDFDEACKIHDYCYANAVENEGCTAIWDEYLAHYEWTMEEGKIICEEDQPKCQKLICECDKKVVETLSEESQKSGCIEENPGCPEITSDN